jgi:hypothetical protein
MDIERAWWFKLGAMLFPAISAAALFYFADMWPVRAHPIAIWLILGLCVVGLTRVYTGAIVALAAYVKQARRLD